MGEVYRSPAQAALLEQAETEDVIESGSMYIGLGPRLTCGDKTVRRRTFEAVKDQFVVIHIDRFSDGTASSTTYRLKSRVKGRS